MKMYMKNSNNVMESGNHFKNRTKLKDFMRREIVKIGSFFLTIVLSITGCSKENKPEDNPEDTDKQIEALYQEIEPLANAILLSENPDWSDLATQYQGREEIKEMDVQEDCFAIEFINGDIRGWLLPQPESTSVFSTSMDILQLSSDMLEKVQTRSTIMDDKKPTIAFVNSNWYTSGSYKEYISDIVIPAFKATWDVAEFNGKSGATINFFANQLSDYDVVFIHAHGAIALNNKIWIETGEEGTSGVINSIKMTIGAGKTAVFNQSDYIDGKEVITSHVFISGDFISDSYAGKTFPNSFIYLSSCHGLQYPDKFAKHFTDNGAKVVVGWNETNCIGLIAGASLINDLMFANRYNLTNAITHMPNEFKINNHRNNSSANPQCLPPTPHYAELVYYGRNGSNTQGALNSGGDYQLPTSTIIKAGNQTWMSKNLDVTQFRNGNTLAFAKTFDEWAYYLDNNIPACCDYLFDESNRNTYGLLYNIHVINDPRNIAPVGWRVPTKADCEYLFQNLPRVDDFLPVYGGSLDGRYYDQETDTYGGFFWGWKDIGAYWWTSTFDPFYNSKLAFGIYSGIFVVRYWSHPTIVHGESYYIRCIKEN